MLAAGSGRRFGGDKLEAVLHGRPLLDHVLNVVDRARRAALLTGGVVVVSGGAPAADRARTAGLDVVENDDPGAGLSRSLRLGLERIATAGPWTGAAMVFLGDQPRVRLETVERLLERWHSADGWCVRPRYAAAPAEPGHPVLLDRRAWPTATASAADAGAMRLLEGLPGGLAIVDVSGANPDVDTAEDLERLRVRDA